MENPGNAQAGKASRRLARRLHRAAAGRLHGSLGFASGLRALFDHRQRNERGPSIVVEQAQAGLA